MDVEDRRLLCIKVTEEKMTAIENLWNYYKWPLHCFLQGDSCGKSRCNHKLKSVCLEYWEDVDYDDEDYDENGEKIVEFTTTEIQLKVLQLMFGAKGWQFERYRTKSSEMLNLVVTPAQKGAIKRLFEEEGWEFQDAIDMENTDWVAYHDKKDRCGGYIKPIEGAEECKQCFCQPCVTDERNRERWWLTPKQPDNNNYKQRMKICRDFCYMQLNRSAMNDPRYKARRELAVTCKLEEYPVWLSDRCLPPYLVPTCVLNVVRSWLPNLSGVPYTSLQV